MLLLIVVKRAMPWNDIKRYIALRQLNRNILRHAAAKGDTETLAHMPAPGLITA